MWRRAAIAFGIHAAAFAANFLLMRWEEARLGMYRIMHGPTDPLTNGITLALGAVYLTSLITLAVLALRDQKHPIKNRVGRLVLVGIATLGQIVLGFLISALGMIFAAGGIPQG